MKYLFIFFALYITPCFSQIPDDIKERLINATAENKDFFYEMPFEYKFGQIIIDVTIGGETFDYVFDTGGFTMVNSYIRNKNDLHLLSSETIGSSNSLKKKTDIVKIDSLKISGLTFKDVPAFALDADSNSMMQCILDNGAMIGAGIIKNYVWKIDFASKKISVTDDISRFDTRGATRIPVQLTDKNIPFINISINGKNEQAMFDLGCASLILAKENKTFRSHDYYEIQGSYIEGSNGRVKEHSKVYRSNTLSIGPFEYSGLPILASGETSHSLIGNILLKDFVVIINLKEKELFFMPYKEAGNLQSEWRSFGLTIGYENGQNIITTIIKDSPAYRQGVREGNILVEINGKDVDCASFCDCKKYFDSFLNENSEIVMKVSDGAREKLITLSKILFN